MAVVNLARLLKKKGVLASILDGLSDLDGQVCILGSDETLLWGRAVQPGSRRAAILLENEPAGWVCGGSHPEAIAALLAYAITQENEKKILAAELLERYRELNLLYHLSEILIASPYPDAIVRAALAEAIRIIPAETGLILLKAGPRSSLKTAAECGKARPVNLGSSLVERVLTTGKALLANAAPGEEFFSESGGQLISIICAPLKTETNTLGVILLAGPAERTFSAGELKLLNTIAQQTAPVIEVSRLHEIELEKARFEREMQMARQVQESLLPQQMPTISGWQFDRRWHPAHDVSGDFYDVIHEGSERLGLVSWRYHR